MNNKLVFLGIILAMLVSSSVLSNETEEVFNSFVESKEQIAKIQQDFLEMRSDLNWMQDNLKQYHQEQLDILHMVDQLRITGTSFGHYTQLNINGPGSDSAYDFLGRTLWYDPLETDLRKRGSKANEQLKVQFAGKPTSRIEVYNDWQANAIWSESGRLIPGKVTIKTNFDRVQTAVGTFYTRFTPLTLYYPKYTPWFEAASFSQARVAWQEEQEIVGNNRVLDGFWGRYIMDDLITQGIFARIREQRFLTGLQSNLVLNEDNIVGLNYVNIKDDLTSLSANSPAMDSSILGGTYWGNPWRNFNLGVEVVRSSYDANVRGDLEAVLDKATVAQLEWQSKNLVLQGNRINIGPFFYAPAAQSSDVKLSESSPMGSVSALTAMEESNEFATDQALPFGYATPNRVGREAQVFWAPHENLRAAYKRLRLAEISPSQELGTATDSFNTRRFFLVERFGGEVNLAGLFVGKASGRQQRPMFLGYQMERRKTRREDDVVTENNEEIDLVTTITDYSLRYLWDSNWSLLGGLKQIDTNGKKGLIEFEQNHTTCMYGIAVDVSDNTQVQLVWQQVLFTDQVQPNNDFNGWSRGITINTQF